MDTFKVKNNSNIEDLLSERKVLYLSLVRTQDKSQRIHINELLQGLDQKIWAKEYNKDYAYDEI